MNILLLGSGGREHAFAWKLSQSPLCSQLFIAPGNAGTSQHGTNLALDPNDFAAVKQAVGEHQISLVVCGPEAPLVGGLGDHFRTDPDLQRVHFVGPSAEAARLEGSKAYAKQFMTEYGIPTAAYREFTGEQLQEGLDYLDTQEGPYVLKADGLAAGKGVVIHTDRAAAKAELEAMLGGKFGSASHRVVIEQFLDGIEFSVFVLTDGRSTRELPAAKDYKRSGDGDTGPNTGGMGSISHPPFVDHDLMRKVEQRIVQPTLRGIRERELDYRGFLFLGLIAVAGEPYLIEYNCRMGDPETQSVFARLQTDLVQLCLNIDQGDLSTALVRVDERAAATVILVSGGYPGAYEKGKVITGLDQVSDCLVFHAGTKQLDNGDIVTNGGRVIGLTAYGDTFQEALEICYRNADKISFEGKNLRRDIGFDL
jgi:phosphoribosylamine--glycine ligase